MYDAAERGDFETFRKEYVNRNLTGMDIVPFISNATLREDTTLFDYIFDEIMRTLKLNKIDSDSADSKKLEENLQDELLNVVRSQQPEPNMTLTPYVKHVLDKLKVNKPQNAFIQNIINKLLQDAVSIRHVVLCGYLIETIKADVSARLVITALNEAFDEDIAILLIHNASDINGILNQSLILASSMGSVDAVRFLLQHHADENADEGQPLHVAATNGHRDVVLQLIKYDIDKAVQNETSHKLKGFNRALLGASGRGHLQIVQDLLNHDYGTINNASLDDALYRAINRTDLSMQSLLTRNGAKKPIDFTNPNNFHWFFANVRRQFPKPNPILETETQDAMDAMLLIKIPIGAIYVSCGNTKSRHRFLFSTQNEWCLRQSTFNQNCKKCPVCTINMIEQKYINTAAPSVASAAAPTPLSHQWFGAAAPPPGDEEFGMTRGMYRGRGIYNDDKYDTRHNDYYTNYNRRY